MNVSFYLKHDKMQVFDGFFKHIVLNCDPEIIVIY